MRERRKWRIGRERRGERGGGPRLAIPVSTLIITPLSHKHRNDPQQHGMGRRGRHRDKNKEKKKRVTNRGSAVVILHGHRRCHGHQYNTIQRNSSRTVFP